jgi:thioredoxin-like negative regulator of GroEL
MLGPVLERVVKEYKGKVVLAKINIEENKKLAEKYKVMSIPSVKLFKNGEIVDSFMGNLPEEAIKKFLDRNLE